MANEQQQQILMVNEDGSVPTELAQIESIQNVLTQSNLKVITNTDILQQALDDTSDFSRESSFSNTQNSVLQESIQHLSDHSYIHSSNPNSIMQDDDIRSQLADSTQNRLKQGNESCKDMQLISISPETSTSLSVINTSHILEAATLSEDANKMCLNGDVLSFNGISDSSNVNVFTGSPSVNNLVSAENIVCYSNANVESSVTEAFSTQSIKNKDSTVPPPGPSLPSTSHDNTTKTLLIRKTNLPVGSPRNPIQLRYQNNKFHSDQVLTPTQLKQVFHLIQKQQTHHVLQDDVMFEPSTNTRIICRVVHPSDIHSNNSDTESNAKQFSVNTSASFRGRGRPRKPKGRKIEDDEKGVSTLSKAEREEKKKHRPRTRSGRISKPPSYMVKDYKRIHHLDFNEEPYDDSDGGYSDYQVSDEEGGKRMDKISSLPPGVTTAKQRNYACSSCNKAYIGKGGLSRHYRLNPSHGSLPVGEDASTQDENSNSSLASSILSNPSCSTNGQTPVTSFFPQAAAKTDSNGPPATQTSSATNNIFASNRRKARLREVLKGYSDEDIQEVILPKFAQNISLWDFFMAKCNRKPEELNFVEMLKEFEIFIAQMQETSHNCLSPVSLQDSEGKTIINISNKQTALAVCLETGPYEVKTTIASSSESSSPVKTFTLNNSVCEPLEIQDAPPLKRNRLDSPVENVTAALPEQILHDPIQDGDALELQLAENLSASTELQQPDNRTLRTSPCNADNHHDIVTKNLFDLSSSTIVTPSSLSSGCLSAVNVPKTHPSALLTTAAPKLQNIQVRKVQLIGTQQPLLPRNGVTVPINSLPISAEGTLSSVSQIINKEPIIVQKQVDECNNNIANVKAFQELPLDIFVQELPTQAVLDNNPESVHTVTSSLINTSLINASNIHNQNVPIDTTQSAPVQAELTDTVSCLPVSHVVSSLQNSSNAVANELQALVPSEVSLSTSVTEESKAFETTHNVISEVSKLPESSVLGHVMLPDGQVLSVWSQFDNTEKVVNEQFVQSYVPGNLIILQNPDGSIQVPNNQGVSAETLQALASLNQGICSENGTQAFTSVHPM